MSRKVVIIIEAEYANLGEILESQLETEIRFGIGQAVDDGLLVGDYRDEVKVDNWDARVEFGLEGAE